MTSQASDRADRLKRIAAILVEESIATYLPFEYGVTLAREAETIELVRTSCDGEKDLPGYMLGIAPGADPESILRAARRIIDELR